MVGVGWSRIVGDAKPLGRPLELQEHLVCDRWDYMPGENADGALFEPKACDWALDYSTHAW